MKLVQIMYPTKEYIPRKNSLYIYNIIHYNQEIKNNSCIFVKDTLISFLQFIDQDLLKFSSYQ